MTREDWTPRWYRGEANLGEINHSQGLDSAMVSRRSEREKRCFRGDRRLWCSPFQVAKLRTTLELQN